MSSQLLFLDQKNWDRNDGKMLGFLLCGWILSWKPPHPLEKKIGTWGALLPGATVDVSYVQLEMWVTAQKWLWSPIIARPVLTWIFFFIIIIIYFHDGNAEKENLLISDSPQEQEHQWDDNTVEMAIFILFHFFVNFRELYIHVFIYFCRLIRLNSQNSVGQKKVI